MKALHLLWAAVLAATPLTAQTILLDTFDDDSRAGPNNLPSSLQWFSTSQTSSLTAANNSLTLATGGSGRGFIGHFAPANNPITLGVGETLALSFDFTTGTLGSGVSDGFRIALTNSFGNQIEGDNWGNRGNEGSSTWAGEGGPYDSYRGYMATFDAQSSPSNPYVKIFERMDNVTGGQQFVAATGTWETLETGGASNPLASNTTYSGYLSISRIDESLFEITTSLTGPGLTNVTLTALDDSPLTTAFDTINIHVGSNAWDAARFDNIHLQVIPEPSTYALIAGGVFLGFAILRRRKISRS